MSKVAKVPLYLDTTQQKKGFKCGDYYMMGFHDKIIHVGDTIEVVRTGERTHWSDEVGVKVIVSGIKMEKTPIKLLKDDTKTQQYDVTVTEADKPYWFKIDKRLPGRFNNQK